jgi:hypothetical protein
MAGAAMGRKKSAGQLPIDREGGAAHGSEREWITDWQRTRVIAQDGQRRGGQACVIAGRHAACGKQGGQQLADAAAIIADDRFPQRHGLQHGAAEGLRLLGKGANERAHGHDLADVRAVAEKGDVPVDAERVDEPAEFVEIRAFFRVSVPGDEAVGRDALRFQGGDEVEKILMAFQPGDAAGE